jgi:hypothetical protein
MKASFCWIFITNLILQSISQCNHWCEGTYQGEGQIVARRPSRFFAASELKRQFARTVKADGKRASNPYEAVTLVGRGPGAGVSSIFIAFPLIRSGTRKACSTISTTGSVCFLLETQRHLMTIILPFK